MQHRSRSSSTPVCFCQWVDDVKRHILSLLESRLCQPGSSWSRGSCSSEMAGWTVLWCQIPRIQHLLHVPGTRVKRMTYFISIFFSVWPSYCIAVKGGQRCVPQSSRDFSGVVPVPETFTQNDRGREKIMKGHLRQRSKQVLKVEEEMEGGRKKHPCGKRDAKVHGWREWEKEYEKEVTICIIQSHWNIQMCSFHSKLYLVLLAVNH